MTVRLPQQSNQSLAERLRADPDPATEESCDLAFLHLVSAGLVSTRPGDLVTATLQVVLAASSGRGTDW